MGTAIGSSPSISTHADSSIAPAAKRRRPAGPVTFRLRAPSGDLWPFEDDDADGAPLTTVEGDAVELCLVAGRRIPGAESDLKAEGPDAEAVLDLVRTFA